jgi:hypothetical protein
MISAHAHRLTAAGPRSVLRVRRPFFVAGGGAFLLALASALAIANFMQVDLAGATADRAKSFMQLLTDRSPGERTEAQLTKHRAAHVLAEREAAPELPKVLSDVLAAPGPAAVVQSALAPVPVPEFATISSAPAIAAAMLPGPGGGVFIGGGSGGGGGGSGGGGGGSGGGGGGGGGGGSGGGGGGSTPGQPTPLTPSTPETPDTPAVPEPGTWMTMLLGFGLIGATLRRQRSQQSTMAAS